MNEEKAKELLNKSINFYKGLDILYNSKEDCPEIKAMEWYITAYEKEKEKNKELENKMKELVNEYQNQLSEKNNYIFNLEKYYKLDEEFD